MHCRCLLALALLLPACGAPSSERDPSTTPDPPTKEPSHHAPSSPNCTLAAQVDDLSIDLRSDEWPGMSLGNVLQGDVEVFFDPATPERARVRATRFGLTIRGWAVARDVPLYSRDAPTFDEVLFPDGLVTVRFAGHAPNRMVRVVYDRDAGSLAAPVDAVLACDALSLEKVTHPPRIGGPLPKKTGIDELV